MNSDQKSVLNFCLIQLEIIKEREMRVRKELLDCKIQKEFLTDTVRNLRGSEKEDGQE
tara:strand:+ start:872 stop:1045 length:174 start_codon:yes stop_codon:yes gene_type:complete